MTSFPLLRTKIEMPIIHSKLVVRPQLLNKIQRGIKKNNLILVCAPPGYGKTTCLAQWAHACKSDVAWFSIDSSDNDPIHFWSYFVAALKALDTTLGQSALNMLNSSSHPSLKTVLTILLNEIVKRQKQLIIILDDYHHISNQSIHSLITYFIDHLPRNLRLVISSRTNPDIHLSRLRSQGQLCELRSLDLRFSLSETSLFLNDLMELGISSEYVVKLNDHTEGWIAGIHLAALSLKDLENDHEFIDSFSGTHHYIANYLVEEIFNRQGENIKSFLLNTSILDRLYGPLCDHVTGRKDSSIVIEQLEDTNLFIYPLDDLGQWYRYHMLFQENLLNRLKRTHPELAPMLHHRASKWFEQNNYPSDAIHHALMGCDYNGAADLIEKHVLETFNRGETATVMNWLTALPENLIRSRPGMCIAHAYAILFNPSSGSNKIIEQRLHEAENIFTSNSHNKFEESYRNLITGYISGIRAHLARERGDPPQKIIELSKKALKNIRKGDPISRSSITMNLAMAYRAIGDATAASEALEESVQIGKQHHLALSTVYSTYLLGQMTYIQGRLQESTLICEEIFRQFTKNHVYADEHFPAIGTLHLCLGTILLEKNKLNEAGKKLSKGIEHLKIMRDLDSLLAGYAALVRLKIAQQTDFLQVSNLIDEMEQLGKEAIQYGCALRINLLLSQARRTPERLSAAALLAQRHGLNLNHRVDHPVIDHMGQRRHEIQLAFVRLLIFQRSIFPRAKGQPGLDNVLLFLDQRLDLAQKRNLNTWIIQLLILKSLTRYARGETDNALSELRQALSLAKHEGFVRIFADEGEPMQKLLRNAIIHGIFPEYTTMLLETIRTDLNDNGKDKLIQVSTSFFEPLSERELQILRLLAAGLSNREIADELFLAEGTVKTHIHNIYGKLNVTKRTRAISRAQELALL